MGKNSENNGTTPICRCRVMYLGSSVPHATKDGLQGIQEPLRELYPETGLLEDGIAGIDSWVSVWSNGILIENVDESRRKVNRFFPIESLHYCAAVRYVIIPSNHDSVDKSFSDKITKFLPLDSPFLRNADNTHPPLFACILRRTSGIKVLECHAFICKREPAANALVRCCFHAYADSMYAKQIEESTYSQVGNRKSRSISALDTVDNKIEPWNENRNLSEDLTPLNQTSNGHQFGAPSEIGALSNISHSPDEDNYKVWPGSSSSREKDENGSMMRSLKPRQMIIANPMLSSPPPPLLAPIIGYPLCPSESDSKAFKHSWKKKKKSKHKQNGSLIMAPSFPPTPHILGNGYPVNFISVPQIPAQGQHHHPSICAPSNVAAAYSMSRRMKRGPQLTHQELPMMFPPNEEPVYIPQMRPLTPLSNYHSHSQSLQDPNYVQYPIQNYGTTSRREKAKSRDKESDREGSPSNLGIYKRKGHMNERAFSYSIRQEHRSRSNSLANLQFEEHNERRGSATSDATKVRERSDSKELRYMNNSNTDRVECLERNGGFYRDNYHHDSSRQLSQNFSNLNINENICEAKKSNNVASIKRSKHSSGSKGRKVSPPMPPIPPPMNLTNGKPSNETSKRK